MSKSGIELKFKSKPNAVKSAINNQKITLNCPNCDNEITITANLICTIVNCPNCKSDINLVDDGFSDSINQLQKQFDNLFK